MLMEDLMTLNIKMYVNQVAQVHLMSYINPMPLIGIVSFSNFRTKNVAVSVVCLHILKLVDIDQFINTPEHFSDVIHKLRANTPSRKHGYRVPAPILSLGYGYLFNKVQLINYHQYRQIGYENILLQLVQSFNLQACFSI